MTRRALTFACGKYDRVDALFTGQIQPDGIDLRCVEVTQPRVIFDRLTRTAEFDVAEYSLSEYVQRRLAGQCPFIAIPVFPSRAFRAGLVAVRDDVGIDAPTDLEGRTIGVPMYTMTAAVFARGFLRDVYGVDFSGVRWVTGAMNTPGRHGNPNILPIYSSPKVTVGPSGQSLDDLIQSRQIDATLGSSEPESVRSDGHVRRLIPDFPRVEADFYRRTRIYPIMHTLVVRREVYNKDPSILHALYGAFCQAKAIALAKMWDLRAHQYMLPWLARDLDEISETFGQDPWPYGVAENRATLEAAARYLVDDGITDRTISPDELFAEFLRA